MGLEKASITTRDKLVPWKDGGHERCTVDTWYLGAKNEGLNEGEGLP